MEFPQKENANKNKTTREVISCQSFIQDNKMTSMFF